jgi:hypothetical protein
MKSVVLTFSWRELQGKDCMVRFIKQEMWLGLLSIGFWYNRTRKVYEIGINRFMRVRKNFDRRVRCSIERSTGQVFWRFNRWNRHFGGIDNNC